MCPCACIHAYDGVCKMMTDSNISVWALKNVASLIVTQKRLENTPLETQIEYPSVERECNTFLYSTLDTAYLDYEKDKW